VVVDERQVTRHPEGMGAVDAAVLMCAGVTVYAALKRCKLRSGQRVGIIGCGGGLGHLGLQFALAMGLRVVGVDNADGPLRLAEDVMKGKDAVWIVDAILKRLLAVKGNKLNPRGCLHTVHPRG
jgi:propanol-preferring alcohol dehydrogenase